MSFNLLWAFYVELGNPHRISNWTPEIDCSNSVNHNQIQVLSYKYSLLFLLVVGIEPTTFRWFHLSTFLPNALYTVLDNSEWIFGTYKPNVSTNLWDTPLHYYIRCFCTIAHITIFFFFAWLWFTEIEWLTYVVQIKGLVPNSVDSQFQHETPEEGWRTYLLKCECNNKDEVNSLNVISNNNYQASSQKFRQIKNWYWILFHL